MSLGFILILLPPQPPLRPNTDLLSVPAQFRRRTTPADSFESFQQQVLNQSEDPQSSGTKIQLLDGSFFVES